LIGAGADFPSLRRLLVVMLAGIAVFAAFAATTASAGVVPTDKGPVRGTQNAAVKQYLGIPYAAAPVGDLRWRPPQPHARWRGPLDASHFGNHCPQPASPFGFESSTEDCLFLNVFTPNRAGRGHAKNLPVMFWIHGGGLTVGESDDYDPTRLVEQGVVVVSLNYRLGLLGFLAHPALSGESGDNASGNYGLMDQQAGLRWVKRNIRKFGGDPGNVTIFGQSAGGLSVHSQLASPLAAGLFSKAIGQSGAYALTLPSLASAEGRGATLAENSLGCTDQTAACLRALPVGNLLAAQPTTEGSVLPNVDGKVLPQSIKAAFDSGQFNRVPVMEGTTHDEFSIFYATNIEFVFGPLPKEFYGFVVPIFLSTVGLHASPAAVMQQYPLSAFENKVAFAVTGIGTDSLFACPGRHAAQALSRFVPTYAYEFNDPKVPQIFVRPASFPYRAYHGSELLSLFDSPPRGGHAPFNEDEESLAAAMVSYWTQFARSGVPSSPRTPEWPAFTTAGDTYQSLVPPTPASSAGFAADHKCAFWDVQP
jgi:para-nitrobenzyl esterase